MIEKTGESIKITASDCQITIVGDNSDTFLLHRIEELSKQNDILTKQLETLDNTIREMDKELKKKSDKCQK